jgi:hypothetical protein
MLSMILQLGGLSDLTRGITGISAANKLADEETRKGNFEFWYQ